MAGCLVSPSVRRPTSDAPVHNDLAVAVQRLIITLPFTRPLMARFAPFPPNPDKVRPRRVPGLKNPRPEIAPVALRGSIGSLNQLMIVIGILVAQVVGLPLATREGWRTLMALAGLPAAVQVVLLFGCVETPSWLASHGLLHDARKSLAFLRGGDRGNLASDGQGDEGTSSNPIDRELDDIFSAAGVSSASTTTDGATSSTTLLLPAASPQPKVTVANLFSVRALRRPLLAAFGLQVAQQFSGINAAIYYSTTIFQQSYDPTTAIRLTLLVSVTNLLTTLLSSSLIERAGRRTLLLTATLGMSLSAALVAGAVRAPSSPTEAVVVGLMAFVGFFGVGLGSIPWLILPELVPGYAVGPAASVCTSVNWSASFALAFVLPKAIGALRYDIFFVFSALLVGFALFTYRYVPETKGLTPEEVAVRNGFV
ncbi:general substrate transporter [Zopfochytrium polystomum]|nr:general substrate transporter [Zopfochytrium polystomum]